MDKIIDLLTRISTLYNLPQWVVNVGAITICIVLVAFPFVVRHLLQPKYYRFRELITFKVLWRWKYQKGEIIGLWCYCPKCESMLMCDDENCRSNATLQNKITYFICNECGGKECGRLVGGDRRYALSLVKRDIWRHINAGSFAEVSKATKEALALYQGLDEECGGIEQALQSVYESHENENSVKDGLSDEIVNKEDETLSKENEMNEPVVIEEEVTIPKEEPQKHGV